MKAILVEEIGNSSKLLYKEIDKPILKDNQILVQMWSSPINFIDTIIREGNMPPGMMPSLPHILGVEGSGIIVDNNNTNFKNGQKVAFLGNIGAATYAEFAAVDADKIILLEDAIDLIEAGTMPVTYFTAYHMLHNVVKAQKGKFAVIYASTGGVGIALTQLAKLAGLKVIGLNRKDDKTKLALELGADYALNTTRCNWVEEVKKITDNKGVDYIFNPIAGNTLHDDLAALGTLGHIVVFGSLGGEGDMNFQAEAIKYFSKAPTISYSEIYATYFSNFPLVKKGLEEIYTLLQQKQIKPLYTTLPLSEASKAHDMLQNGQIKGKLTLLPH